MAPEAHAGLAPWRDGATPVQRGADANGGDVAVSARTGVLSLRAASVAFAAEGHDLKAPGFVFEPGARYVLMLDGPLSADRRRALERLGAKVLDYLPTNAVLCQFTRARRHDPAALPFVVSAMKYQDAWKRDPDLDRAAAMVGDTIALSITLFDGEDAAPVGAVVARLAGAKETGREQIGDRTVLTVSLPRQSAARAAAALAAVPAVRFIEECHDFSARNSTVRWIGQGNVPDQTPLYAHGLTGAGAVMGVIDSRVDPNHCSFFDAQPFGPAHRKILAYNASVGADFHGTHVAGTALGDAGAFDDARGVAYAAKLVYNTYPSATEASVYSKLDLHRTQGAFVHNNSYGTDSTNAYNGSCVGIDRFCWEHDDQLVVFAVSDSLQVRNPENAKNCLAVSASFDAPDQEFWGVGGAGPTSDGRRRPEVMAPGFGITSAAAGEACGLATSSGTSMACPAVSGVGLLARQYFTQGCYPSGQASATDSFVPSGALLKAVIVNSARDMTGEPGFPNLREGWGRATADDALFFAGDARRLVVSHAFNNQPGAMETGGREIMRVLVGTGQAFKVTLAFHDAPAAIGASFAPVNDLNLRALSPAGAEFLGNAFSGGQSAAGGTPDAINNVEQVLLSSPPAGVWRVVIDAPAVNVGEQGYGLVVSGEVSPLCDADFDGDGFVTGLDFDSFVGAFEAGDPLADFDADGFITGLDFDAFVGAFEAGC